MSLSAAPCLLSRLGGWGRGGEGDRSGPRGAAAAAAARGGGGERGGALAGVAVAAALAQVAGGLLYMRGAAATAPLALPLHVRTVRLVCSENALARALSDG